MILGLPWDFVVFILFPTLLMWAIVLLYYLGVFGREDEEVQS